MANPADSINSLSGAIDTLLGHFVQLDEALEKVRDQFGKYVEQLNPGTMFAFNLEMRNLQATIGVALEPAFRRLTEIVSNIGGAILPTMERFAPIIDKLTKAFGNTLIIAIDLITTGFESLSPIIEAFADILSGVSSALRIGMAFVTSAFTIFVDGIKAILSPFESIFRFFFDAVSNLAHSLITTAARIAMILPGGAELIDRMLQRLEPGPGRAAAPYDPRIMQVQQIANDIATAAFAAGGAPQRETNDWLREILQELRQIRQEGRGGAARALLRPRGAVGAGAFDAFADVMSFGPAEPSVGQMG